MKKIILIIFLCLLCSLMIHAQTTVKVPAVSTVSLPWFGQKPPGLVPQLFAPGIISLDNREESFITFSPDGRECYFTVHQKEWAPYHIMMSVYRNGTWTTPQKAPFSNEESLCTDISPDGTKLFLGFNAGVYQCSRNADGGWSAPVEMDRQISSGQMEFSCHLSDKGNMFVCSWRSGGKGGCDGWRIPCVDGQWQQAENLGDLNSPVGDCCWAPGPNEDYLIFQTRRPPTGGGGGFFNTDLFITRALPGGKWSDPQNLGPAINSDSTDGFAWISHDGLYLFFSSNRRGTDDIYWVSVDGFLRDPILTSAIRDLSPQKPEDYVLYQKVPISTDTTTTIEYVLNKPRYTLLTIYNLANQKLETLTDEYKPAGKYQVTWKGLGLQKGEYFCKLQVREEKTGPFFLESVIQVLLR